MRVLKAIIAILVMGSIVFVSLSCSGAGASATPKPTISTVQRGNITIAVTGTGNLALEYKQGLSFGQTGLVSQASNAKISEVLIKEGDTVEEGQVLVKADTSDMQDQITQDQHNLDTAKANLLTAQNNLKTDQTKLSQQTDVQAIQTKIDNTNILLQNAQAMLQQSITSPDPNALAQRQYWQNMIAYYTTDTNSFSSSSHKADGGLLAKYQKDMAELLADPQHYLAANVANSAASLAAIKNIQMQIEQDKSNIILKQNAVDDAQAKMDADKAAAQEIKAPYKGLITKVTVTPGDIVQRNADLVEIAQQDKYIANILVTERDVMSIQIGKDATVSFDALQGLSFPAKITQIAPLATVQQGVVNYKVTVELTSTRPVFPSFSGSGQRPQQATTGSATGPTGTPRATSTVTPNPSGTPRVMTGGNLPSGAGNPQSLTLKDGLSATVNIVVQERTSILMVPSRAVTRQGQNSTVQKVNGTSTESVVVRTGITDSANTEITEGLNEGDQVSIQPRPTSTTASGNQFRPPGGGMIIR